MRACLFALVLLFAAACGGGDDSTDASDQDQVETEDSTSETGGNELSIAMQDYAFGIEGEPTAGPVTLNFSNDGDEIHHGILGKLDDGKTFDDVQKFLQKGMNGPPPPWFDDSPADMSLISPGKTAGLVTELEEGTYVFLCFMPSPQGAPHVSEGMFNTFEVGAATDAPAPESASTISISEDGVEAGEIPSGSSVVEVNNDGSGKGEFLVSLFESGKGTADVDKWFGSGQKGVPPAQFYGGTHEIEPGGSVTMVLDLEPGTYEVVATYGGGKNRKDVTGELVVTE